MSARTAAASKVIAEAWDNEQQLIREGKGTRDWTPEQQQDILEKGKAYDENGKAFEGHHMKSVEKYPEYQGDLGNIQFLNRKEHLEAHGGSYRNPTNGYFDPITKFTSNFGDEKFKPCKVINLSDPMMHMEIGNKVDENKNNIVMCQDDIIDINNNNIQTKKTIISNTDKNTVVKQPKGVKRFIGGAVEFYKKHQNIINPILEIGGPIIGGLILDKVSGKVFSKTKSKKMLDGNTSKSMVNIEKTKEILEREKPAAHIVSGHKQRYNGVWKEKAPYSRGGKK